jgi:hypothetical protein
LSGLLFGCSDRNGDDPNRKTNSGYVAFDYTCNAFRNYAPVLREIYRFNEYFKQPTPARRDSVDKLYFRNVKIFYDEQTDLWTLRPTQNYYTDFSAISIQTNGQTLDETGALWSISADITESYYYEMPFTFDVESKGDQVWHIPQHDNACDGTFDYTAAWEIRFKDGEKSFAIKGNGTLLSIKSPKLKLEYVTTEPLEISANSDRLSVSSGALRILATDVDKNLTEETSVNILSNETIEVTYFKHVEHWNYVIFW